jgi:hypothetical protein
MAADFQNTIRQVWTTFFAHLQGLIGTTGSGSSLAIRRVVEGEGLPDQYPTPFIAVRIDKIEPTSRQDTQKVRTITLRVKFITEVSTANGAAGEMLSKIALIDNKIESFVKPAGVTGFEDNEWGTIYFSDSDKGNKIGAQSELKFTVAMARAGS